MRDDDAVLSRSKAQNLRIGYSVESRRERALEVDGGFTPQHTNAKRTAKVIVGLESGPHLLRVR